MRFDDWLAARTARHDLAISAPDLRARYEAGAKLLTLATQYHASISTIRNRLLKAGTKMRGPGSRT